MKDQANDEREFMSVADFAEALDVDTSTVRKAIAEGRIPAVRLIERGAWRIPRRVLDELLGANTMADFTETVTLAAGGARRTR